MAQPNGLNPTFGGSVKATGFDGIHGYGVSTTARPTSGTTKVDFFGTTCGFYGTITGVFALCTQGTVATIIVSLDSATVVSIVTTTAGAMNGATSAPAVTAITPGSTLKIVSTQPLTNATVYLTYIVA